MACPEMRLEGITEERYARLLETAQAQGLNLSGECGKTHYQGMEFAWSYDAAGAALTIQCVEKPIFVPCGMIEGRIRALVG
ncbi:MAG TPA: hypothetical protein VL346_12830 [Acidobacteriaceae bacterium]|nr:hypothetical protein [Acidobacteriaceae bacterium]